MENFENNNNNNNNIKNRNIENNENNKDIERNENNDNNIKNKNIENNKNIEKNENINKNENYLKNLDDKIENKLSYKNINYNKKLKNTEINNKLNTNKKNINQLNNEKCEIYDNLKIETENNDNNNNNNNNDKKYFNYIEDFYEEYRELKFSSDANNNLDVDSLLHINLIHEFKKKYENSLKKNSEFQKFIIKNQLNLFDLEIYAISKFQYLKDIDDKEIFEQLILFELKEYDFELFKKYLFNSNLVKNKMIDYELENSENIQNSMKLTSNEKNKILKSELKTKIKRYKNLIEIENDLNYFYNIDEILIDNNIKNNKKYLLKLITKIKKNLVLNLKITSDKFKFINKLKLNTFETLFLLELYFNQDKPDSKSVIRFKSIFENNIISKKFSNKFKITLNKKLEKLNYITVKEEFGEIKHIISNKLISIIEEREYDENDKSKDQELFLEDKFLKPVISNIKIDDVHISTHKKEILKNTLAQIENHNLIFNTWGMGESLDYGKGLILNFHGLPGTGKTMMAKSIGNYLNKKIIEVDFSELQNYYVGVTEKNISKAFKVAKENDAILFFDEADSLIQNRSNSKNSWERTQTNVLLKEIENFEGVCIFATNLLSNYDPAIERRISLNLEFENPSTDLRIKIFENHFKKKQYLDKDVNFEKLSKEYDFNGGEIKNAIMHAIRFASVDKENITKKIKFKHLKFGCDLVVSGRFNNKNKIHENSNIYL